MLTKLNWQGPQTIKELTGWLIKYKKSAMPYALVRGLTFDGYGFQASWGNTEEEAIATPYFSNCYNYDLSQIILLRKIF